MLGVCESIHYPVAIVEICVKVLRQSFQLCPPWFNYWFPFTLAYSRVRHEYSSLFIKVINMIFMFSL